MKTLAILAIALLPLTAMSQDIRYDLPGTIRPTGFYLFYLHGGIVTVKGDNSINDPVPEFGPYQYSRILDTLRAHGFQVISERRFPGIDDTVYAQKIANQIDTLLKAYVPASHILLVGASAGSNIVLLVSDKVKEPELKYVMMGGCSPNVYQYYVSIDLHGHFLSIIEASDSRGSCKRIFENRRQLKSFDEAELRTGLNHGFIYRPFAAWIDAVTHWFGTHTPRYKARKASQISGTNGDSFF